MSKNIKYAIISSLEKSAWGGSEELWYRFALEQAKKNNPVFVSIVRLPNEHQNIEALRRQSVIVKKRPGIKKAKLIHLFTRFLPNGNKLLTYYYFSSLLKFDPDYILLSQGDTFTFAKNRKYHELIKKYKGRFILISQANCEHGNYLRKKTREQAISLLKYIPSFYFVSRRNHEVAERQLAKKIYNCRFISNPVTIKSVDKKKLPDLSKVKMACVARIDCSYKGQDLLLHALSLTKWDKSTFELNFFGTGADEEYLNYLIDFYGLKTCVFVKGQTDDIDAIWESHHLLVLPSLMEGTPLSLIEAMLAGRTALATDVGGIGEYIINGKTGFLCDAPTVNLILKSLQEVWENRDQLKGYGERAFVHAKKITDLTPWKTLERDILELKASLINQENNIA